MAKCPDVVKRLIERFDQQADQVRSPDYNETQLRIDFINPMFSQLGWDMDNAQGFAEQYREVVHEDRVKVAGTTKAPDYSFRIGGVRKFFLEAKKPFVNIKTAWEPAYQLRRYAWSAKLAVSLLTDFEEFAIYDCRIRPKQMEKPSVARREYITYTEYPRRWDFIEGTFSKRAVLTGDFDRYCATSKGRGAEEFDDVFLAEIEVWRKKLASNIALRNERVDAQDLNFAVQRIIDRIIFLRICEDRGAEPVGHLRHLLNGENIYERLAKLFRDADARYNSGLFHFKPEPGRDETPDELTPSLEIDDSTLKQILKQLYYPDSPYEFAVVSADILGSVYERFLGNVIELTASRHVKVEQKPEVRKAGGVYYTPAFIVDYIVKQTVSKLLEGKAPREAAKIKILDPACGSGSFLLGAYQYLLDWHLNWYVTDSTEKHSKGKDATIRPADKPSYTAQNAGAAHDPNPSLGHWALTTHERKRILLDNIHGVDIDYQAVEVTKLSLLLRCLEGETAESIRAQMTLFHERALPDLGRNIQCGNSLIGTDITHADAWGTMTDAEKQKINPFDFDRSFSTVFKQGKFDVVIGNPPWGADFPDVIRPYLSRHYPGVADFESSQYFMHRMMGLLADDGVAGQIIPNTFVLNVYAKRARQLMCERGSFGVIVDLSEMDAFLGPHVRSCVVTWCTNKARQADCFVWDNAVEPPKFLRHAKQEELVSLDTWKRLLEADSPIRSIIERIDNQGSKLEEYATVRQGYIPYRTTTLTNRHGARKAAEIVKTRAFHSGRRVDRFHQRELQGSDVGRYEMKWSGVWVRYGEWVSTYLPLELFSGPRVLIREITGKPPHRLFAAFTDQIFVHNPSVLAALPKPSSVDAKFVLGILNSKFTSLAFSVLAPKAKKGLFPKIIITDAKRIPFPQINLALRKDRQRHDSLVKLVDSLLALHNAEQSARLPHAKEQIHRRMASIDRQIDQLVYELYGLTDKEIEIVEAATE